MSLDLLNVGCGKRWDRRWVNLDIDPGCPEIVNHDVRQGLPFEEGKFDGIYQSHVLEHLSREDGDKMINECFRCLKAGGILRIVVPDLEGIARSYLRFLEEALAVDEGAEFRYDWTLLELFDQLIRVQSGGDVPAVLATGCDAEIDFVKSRIGCELESIESFQRHRKMETGGLEESVLRRVLRGVKRFTVEPLYRSDVLLRMILGNDYRYAVGFGRRRSLVREVIWKWSLGSDYSLLKIAQFRESGEVHRWMYDRYSLGRILKRTGFTEVRVVDANRSLIPDWEEYSLDVNLEGEAAKPDSVYVEGVKPGSGDENI